MNRGILFTSIGVFFFLNFGWCESNLFAAPMNEAKKGTLPARELPPFTKDLFKKDGSSTAAAIQAHGKTMAPDTGRAEIVTDPIIRTDLASYHFEHDAVVYCLGTDGALDSVNFIVTIDGKPDWIESVYSVHWGRQVGYRSFAGKSATESVFGCDDIQPDPSHGGKLPDGWEFDSDYQGFIVMGDFVTTGLTWKEYKNLVDSKPAPSVQPGDSGVIATAVGLLLTHSLSEHSQSDLCQHTEAEDLAAHVLLLANSAAEAKYKSNISIEYPR